MQEDNSRLTAMDRTIFELHDRKPRRAALFTEKHMKSWIRPQCLLMSPTVSVKISFGPLRENVSYLVAGNCFYYFFKSENKTLPAAKHGGGLVQFRAALLNLGSGNHNKSEQGIMKYQDCLGIPTHAAKCQKAMSQSHLNGSSNKITISEV